MEHFEAGIKLVEQGLASAIEMIGHVQRAGGQSAKYLKRRNWERYMIIIEPVTLHHCHSITLLLYYFITLSLFYLITLIYNLVSLSPSSHLHCAPYPLWQSKRDSRVAPFCGTGNSVRNHVAMYWRSATTSIPRRVPANERKAFRCK